MAFSRSVNTHFDFRTQYAAGYMVRTGHARQLYDYDETRQIQNQLVSPSDRTLPFIHLAYEALFYAPFSLFTYETAYFLYFGVNVAFLAWAFFLLRPYLSGLAEIWSYLPAAIFLCFLPVTMTLLEGQNSILLLVLMIAVMVRLDRGEDLWAGLLLGLASVKFQYVIPVAVLFLICRRWRFLAGFAVSSASVVVISVWLTGVAGFLSYFRLLGSMSAHFSSQNGMHLGIRPELMPNLRGLVYAISGSSSLTISLVTLFLSAAVLLWTATRRLSFPLALLASLLVSYHETFTDASLLIVPIAVAVTAAVKTRGARSLYIVLLSAVIVVAPAVLLLAGVRFYLLAIPIVALFILWDDEIQFPSSTTASNRGDFAIKLIGNVRKRILPNRRNFEAVSDLSTGAVDRVRGKFQDAFRPQRNPGNAKWANVFFYVHNLFFLAQKNQVDRKQHPDRMHATRGDDPQTSA
jgi:Glycosyltransferase family 87